MNEAKPELNIDEVKFVEKRYVRLKEEGKLPSDDALLLEDAIESLKQNLFFATSSLLLVLLEKYIRTSLVMYQIKQDTPDIIDLMPRIEEIEREIEDGGQEYWFKRLCNKLKKNGLIEETIVEELKTAYDNLRHPIQHGIYGRLIRNISGDQKIPIFAGKLPENATKKDLESMVGHGVTGTPNTQTGLHNLILRRFVLPGAFKNISLQLLSLFQRVVEQVVQSKKIL